MRRTTCLMSCLLVMVLAPAALGVITGSAHDFQGDYGLTEICKPCHVPHNSGVEGAAVENVLWSHDTTAATFEMYNDFKVDRDDRGTLVIGGTTKLCLSCHDGTVAIDAFPGGDPGTTFMTGSPLLGTDLTNDHPIGLEYPTDPVGDSLAYDIADNVEAAGLPLATWGSFTQSVECSTCHDVHNGPGIAKLLRIENTGSALCLTCHQK